MRNTTGVVSGLLALYVVLIWILSGTGDVVFHNLHIALDAGNAVLSGLFALFLWANAYARQEAGCRAHLALAFAFLSASELGHALLGIEWSGDWSWLAAASHELRPATWPPSTYFLPLAMLLALPAAKRPVSLPAFAAALSLLLLGLVLLFLHLPSYVEPGIAGIRRPFQVPLLPLLAAVGWLYWRERERDPLFAPLVACTAFLFLADFFMLGSATPHDRWAMSAHVGKFIAYLIAHGAMVKLALDDTIARNRAQAELHATVGILSASEAKFRQLLESAPDAMVVIDAQGRIGLVSGRAEALFGYTREELMGQPVEALLPPRHRDSHQAQRRDYAARPYEAGIHSRDNLVALGKDGREFPVEISLSPLDSEKGRVIVAAVRDVSERQAMERELESYRARLERLVATRTAELTASEARFRNLVEQSLVGICIIQGENYRYVNPALVAMSGYVDAEEMMARGSIRNGVAAADRQRVALNLARLAAGEVPALHLDYAGLRADGSLRHIEGHARRCQFEGEPAIIGILLDVTERKQAERELQRLNADLERRVDERTAQLLALNRELQAFTYAASHDLKAPLRTINSFSGLLENRYRSQLEGDGLLFLNFIRRGAIRMTALIDDLLDYARVDQGGRDTEAVDLAAAMRGILAEFQDEIRQRSAQVRLELPPGAVHANASGLAQVLRNLLGNALKYTANAASPRIDIDGEVAAGKYLFRIRDNGIGFDMAYRERIFDIFHRLHTYDEYQGSGIGLALVRKAMERMGGRAWAEGAPGRGATFYLQLQCADALPDWESPAPASAQEA